MLRRLLSSAPQCLICAECCTTHLCGVPEVNKVLAEGDERLGILREQHIISLLNIVYAPHLALLFQLLHAEIALSASTNIELRTFIQSHTKISQSDCRRSSKQANWTDMWSALKKDDMLVKYKITAAVLLVA